MKIKELLDLGHETLKENGIKNSRFEAELLLSEQLSCDRVYFYAHPQEELEDAVLVNYKAFLKRRANHEPMAYILGKKEFMGLCFKVNPSVLIPRPDTEPMVEYLIEFLNKAYPDGATIFDLCTGTGAIGIALKRYFPMGRVFLGDISKEALKIAEENSKALVKGTVSLILGDLFQGITAKKEKFDLIVSNPPYIKKEAMKALARDIFDYEPHLALDGGASGLVFYEKIIAEAKGYLKTPGFLALEIGDDQENLVQKILIQHDYEEIVKIRDLAGHIRCLIGKNNRKPFEIS